MSLRTLRDTHLQINAVANDVHLDGIELIKQITVVPIGIAHSIFVLGESLVQLLLVVDVTFLHTENIGQSLYVAHPIGRIHRVAYPRDVADEVFLAFVHLHIDVDMLRVDVPHAILDDDGIAETVFVVFINEFLLIFLPAVGRELLSLQERGQLTCLVGLRKGTLREEPSLNLLIGELFVAFDVDGAHLHFLLLINHHVKDDAILLRHVLTLQDLDVGILKALVVEVFLGKDLRTVDDIRVYAHALCHTEFLLHILTLRLLQTHIVDFRHTRTCSQRDVEPDAVAHDGISSNRDIREQTVTPVALHGIGNLRTRHFDFLTNGQTGDTCECIVLVAFHTRDVDAAQYQGARRAGIRDIRKLNDVLGL